MQLKQLFDQTFSERWSHGDLRWQLMDVADHNRDDMRACINRLLEFGENQSVLDTEMLARLRSEDYNQFQSAIYELAIAEFLSSIGRINWRPKGRGLHIGEFELELEKHAPVFIEVKTIFENEFIERQYRNWDKIKVITHSISSPFIIAIEFLELPHDINSKHFRAWFIKQLDEVSVKIKTNRKNKEVIFEDRKIRIKVRFTRLWKEDQPILCSLDYGVHWDGTHERIIDTVDRALKQLPNTQPTLVIVVPAIAFGLDESQILTAMFSFPKITFPLITSLDDSNEKHAEENSGIHYDLQGIVQPSVRTRLSAIGIWHQQWTEKPSGSLHIYHNPLTAKIIDHSALEVPGIYQLVPKCKGTMEWIPERPNKG